MGQTQPKSRPEIATFSPGKLCPVPLNSQVMHWPSSMMLNFQAGLILNAYTVRESYLSIARMVRGSYRRADVGLVQIASSDS